MLVTLRNFKNGCSLSNIRECPALGFLSPYDMLIVHMLCYHDLCYHLRLFFFMTVYGPHGCAVLHFQRSQCVLSHVCCASLSGHILQSWHKVSELPWISDFYY